MRQIAISPDGRNLAYTGQNPETSSDLWVLPLDTSDPEHPKPGAPKALLRTKAAEGAPAFSPDGRWIAYITDESGSYNVYVQSFPGSLH